MAGNVADPPHEQTVRPPYREAGAEKRGLKWALTNWTYENLGATKEEMEETEQE